MEKPNTVSKTNLADAERQQVLAALLIRSTNGRLKHGDIAVAETEGIHPSTIFRIWTRAKTEEARTGRFASPSRRLRSGRRPADHTAMLERLQGVDVVERSAVRSVAAPPRSCECTKPLLTEANKVQRLQFALSHIQRNTMLFDDMLDAVHVDEKLFYITQPTRRFLLLLGEVAPVRRLYSRHYITCVVVLAAIARPRKHVVVQQDNAPAHIPKADAAFAEAARASGCNVVLRNQPPNCPGLFSAVQMRQRKKRVRTIDELIEVVVSSYWELPMRTINAAFLSVQGSLGDSIAQAGDNNYKPRHMKKEKLRREGRLSVSIRYCEREEQILTGSVTL
uniref:DUF7769 domain-containing protein n=1 Tax=Phytophthora ramorum TaxID=164328 RepID=H3GNH2_PHYRM